MRWFDIAVIVAVLVWVFALIDLAAAMTFCETSCDSYGNCETICWDY